MYRNFPAEVTEKDGDGGMQYAATASHVKNVRFIDPTRATTRAPVKAGEEDTVRILTECSFQVRGAAWWANFHSQERIIAWMGVPLCVERPCDNSQIGDEELSQDH